MADEMVSSGRLIIVSFDPGETTGYSRLSLSKRLLLRRGTTEALTEANRGRRIRYDQFGLKGSGLALSEEANADRMILLTRLGWVEEVLDPVVDTFVVVIEDFVLFRQEKSRNLLSPVRLTARYEQGMKGSGVPIVKQMPGEAKHVVTDARLRRWHMYDDLEGGRVIGKHARDALRHSILFARKWSSRLEIRESVGVGRRVVASQDLLTTTKEEEEERDSIS